MAAAAGAAPQPPGFVRTLVFNVGALAIAYVLLLSGLHKFTYKLWDVELSKELFQSLDRFYVLSVRRGHEVWWCVRTCPSRSVWSFPHPHASTD